MNGRMSFLPLLSSCLLAPIVLHAEQAPCRQNDLAGHTYKLVYLRETPQARETMQYKHAPYQYLAFYPEYRYSYVTAQREVSSPAMLNQELQWSHAHHLLYGLGVDGSIALYFDKIAAYTYQCNVVTHAEDGYAVGDVALTGHAKDSNTELFKLYRRWY